MYVLVKVLNTEPHAESPIVSIYILLILILFVFYFATVFLYFYFLFNFICFFLWFFLYFFGFLRLFNSKAICTQYKWLVMSYSWVWYSEWVLLPVGMSTNLYLPPTYHDCAHMLTHPSTPPLLHYLLRPHLLETNTNRETHTHKTYYLQHTYTTWSIYKWARSSRHSKY